MDCRDQSNRILSDAELPCHDLPSVLAKVPFDKDWNQSFMIKVAELEVDRLRQSVKQLIERHDAFRLRYWQEPYAWLGMKILWNTQSSYKLGVTTTSVLLPTRLFWRFGFLLF